MAYAKGTTVPIDRTKVEIERTLARYGAEQFVSGWDLHSAALAFRAHDRQVRFTLRYQPIEEFRKTAQGRTRTRDAQIQAYEQAQRERWRALLLVIKAKLEAVESGIVSFEEEFLAHVVLPDGTTMIEWAHPQLALAYDSGRMPSVLPALGSGDG